MSSAAPSRFSRFTSALTRYSDAFYMAWDPEYGNKRLEERRAAEVKAFFHNRRVMRMSAWEDDERDWPGGGGFNSARTGRDGHTWFTSLLSPNSGLELDLETQRERSNSAYKNYPLYSGHIERKVNRVAGTGIATAPQIIPVPGKITEDQAKEWNRILRDDFERWCHKAGGNRMPYYVIERIAERHVEKDGVAYIQYGDVRQRDPRIPVSLRVKLVHPRRVETPPEFMMDPNVRMGHRVNDDGDILGYYVRTAIPGDSKKFEYKHEFVPAEFPNGFPRMTHVGEPREAEQTLGYPQGQVSLSRLKNSEEYEEAELERNIVASCFTAFVHGSADPADAALAGSAYTDSRGNRVTEMAPGRVEYVGDEAGGVTLSNPPGPQGTFAPYVEHQGRMAAAGCVTSLEMMSGNWANVSYSGGKLIWVDEQGTIDIGQLDLIEMFLLPTWQNFINREITAGRIEVSQANYRAMPWIYERCKFIPPKRMSIDPARERASVREDIAAGLIVHSEEVEQVNGRPAEEVYADIERNNKQLEKIGVSIDQLSSKGGTPLGGTNDTAAEGGKGRAKREQVGAA